MNHIEQINKAAHRGGFDQVCLLFQKAKNKGLANELMYWTMTGICNKFIINAINQQELGRAENLFTYARKQGIADSDTYHMMINAEATQGDLNLVVTLFEEAQNANLVNYSIYKTMTVIFNKAIRVAIDQGNLDFARKLFESATKQGMPDLATYCIMIEAEITQRNLNNVYTLFKEAQNANLVNGYICKNTMTIIFSQAIRVAIDQGNPAFARTFFKQAREQGIADSPIYEMMIKVEATQKKNLDDVYTLFQQAHRQGLATKSIRTTVISIVHDALRHAIAQKNFDHANTIFESAKKHGVADALAYFIINEAKRDHPDLGLGYNPSPFQQVQNQTPVDKIAHHSLPAQNDKHNVDDVKHLATQSHGFFLPSIEPRRCKSVPHKKVLPTPGKFAHDVEKIQQSFENSGRKSSFA